MADSMSVPRFVLVVVPQTPAWSPVVIRVNRREGEKVLI
jgi:hypothetical protein